tara:strand:+ start:87794 stop:88252 length:459 start_codon:yes stop_codon:yes gene_type:complete
MKNRVSTYQIERMNADLSETVLLFLEAVFHDEQHIPKDLIPIKSAQQEWWCIKKGSETMGTVAAWKEKGVWHWGRLAIDQKVRGQGLGKKLVTASLTDLFQMGLEKITIDARDITVDLVLKLGGKTVGAKTNFYGHPITPMEIHKNNFIQNL